MKYLIIYLFTMTSALAGFPPTTIKGQEDTAKPSTFNFEVPNFQSTSLGSTTKLIETGNNNELQNPNFEHSTVTTGWTVSNATASANTTTEIQGTKALSLALTGALSLSQSSTINAAQKANVQMVASVWVNSSDVSDLQLCSLKNGSEDKCTVAGGYVQGSGWRQLTVSFIGNAISNGLKLKSTDTTGTVLVDQAFVGVGSPIVDFAPDMVYSAKVSAAGVVSDENTDWINGNASISNTSTYLLTFNTGMFTTAPNCVASVNQGSTYVVMMEFPATTTSVSPRTVLSTTAGNNAGAFNIYCQKTGSDYKTSKAYVASGSVVLNTTVYSAKVSSTGVVTDENTDWINGNCSGSAAYTCTFTTGIFTIAPNCWAQGSNSGVTTVAYQVQNNASGITSVDFVNSSWARVNSTFTLYCQKQGADYTASFNPVIVGSFQGYNETPGVSAPKMFSFRVDSAGGVNNDIGDLVNGNCTNANPHVCTLNVGKFTTTPNCTANTASTGSFGVIGVDPSASSISIQARDSAFAANNGIYSKIITCHGY